MKVENEQRQDVNKTISEILNCGICGKILNEPRIIPCSHSFCSLCISNILYSTLKLQKQQQEGVEVGQEEQGSIKFKCPICKSEHQNIQSSTQLPKNYFLENILRSLHLNFSTSNSNNNNDNNGEKKSIIRGCERDESHKATVYCSKCKAYLCEDCFNTVHTFGKLKQHTPQSLDDIINTTITTHHVNNGESPKCTKHPKYHADLYCESCQSSICQMCWVDNHNDSTKHKVTSASKYAEIIKSKLLQRCDLILTDSSKLTDELHATSDLIIDLQNKIADLQSRLESENQKKSNLQNKLNDLNSIHQIIITAINQYFNDYDLINQQTVNHCSADISMFYEKLYSLKSPLSLNLFDPLPLPLTITDDDIWSLNPNSFKGNVSSYKLISNKHFEKLKAGHCAITCIESIKHSATPAHYQWQIQYLAPQLQSYQGWLLIGLHSNSSASTQSSYSDKEFIGWNISCKSGTIPTNNYSYFYGKYTSIGRLQAERGDILKFSFNTKSKTIRLEHPSWHVETTLQFDFDHYYLHFNSYDVSFKLLSCSLLLN